MSSPNKESMLTAPDAQAPATSLRPQIASAYSLATNPCGISPNRSMRRVSNMPSV